MVNSRTIELYPVPERGGDADKWLHMAGNEVFKVAVTQLSKLVKDTRSKQHVQVWSWISLVPHQANHCCILVTAKKTLCL